MAVNPEYKAYVLDQLSPLGPVMARAMFGGAGIYLDGIMFALITRADVLYFRTGDANRDEYEDADMGPFVTNKEKSTVMPYHEVPPDVIEDSDDMCDWARRAWDVAKAAKKK
ncbi:MAG: TfoX/Sxy family protein [Rhodospirillaceae bacterium]|jgi:DNA transformation protein and related proteins|nr:TfoX/Sxy family protein [Rhodospirillaceae bacterium]